VGHVLIDELVAYPSDVLAGLDLNRLAAYTLKVLLDRRIPATFENIVAAAFKLFPEKFSLVGYPEYPDAARVNRALLQLGPKYRNWARGSVQKGFVLNETGIAEVNRVEKVLTGSVSPKTGSKSRGGKLQPRTLDLGAEIKKIKESSLFGKWRSGVLQSATELEFFDLLGAFSYSPPRAMADRLDSLQNAAVQLGRQDVVQFLEELRTRFRSSLLQK